MQYWLMKTEPEVFSIADLENAPGKKAGWDGVRNYQARNFMRDNMRVGDGVLFYHSSCTPPGIAGLATVSKECYPDPTQFDRKNQYYDAKASAANPIWFMVEVRFQEKWNGLVTLDEIRTQSKRLKDLALLRKGNRLSIMPVNPEAWNLLVSLGRAK